MDNYSGAEDQFFDIASSPFSSDCADVCLNSGHDRCALGYEFWTKEPESVNKRRDRFLRWMMDLSSDGQTNEVEEEDSFPACERWDDVNRLKDDGEANLATKSQFFSSNSLLSFQSCDDDQLLEDVNMEENLASITKNQEYGTESYDGSVTPSIDLSSDNMMSFDEFRKTLSSSFLVQQLLDKERKGFSINDSKKKNNWFKRLNTITHFVDRAKEFLGKFEFDPEIGSSRSVRVNVCKKNSKELSSLQTGQEIPAHEGSILTMKFSPDGMHLASAGVDGVVRVWKVQEDDFVNKFNAQDIDPSSLYFSLNHYFKLAPLDVAKEKNDHVKNLKQSSDSACVILPPKVFQLSEKPLHEFHGHKGEVLALSWSKNGQLLSSSVDKTARLWRVGYEHCLGVYSHNNYVTCVDFNPVDDNHFISGSIDGKLRIWEVQGGRVVDWTDITEIITAVVYRPDGKGGVVGSMNGTCCFYDIIDNRLQLGDSICLTGKKKLLAKKIIGFQYCPSDSSKIMVTSGDSQVQILCGTNIVCKFKGNRSCSVSQMPAAFTSDGEHVVSATGDSSVRLWNYTDHDQRKSSRSKKNIWSCESFLSRNASIAIPWCGLKNKLGAIPGSILGNGHFDEKLLQKFHASFPDCFTMSLGYFLDALYRGSATWPQEKLLKSTPVPVKLKFLKNAWMNALNSPNLWGLVVVTAGLDGCIRTFLNYGLPIKF